LAKLSAGQGTLAPDPLVEHPGKSGNPVQKGQGMVLGHPEKKAN
jgi:hypothetical protein